MAVALQNLVVTIAAIGAAGYFVRRLFGAPSAQPTRSSAPPCLSGAGCQLHSPVQKSRARSAKKSALTN